VLQVDTFIREHGQRLQALAGEVREISAAAGRSTYGVLDANAGRAERSTNRDATPRDAA
jgi:hypothetical protein